ncbi:membrane protein [Methylogaea oryzae]|uniref:Membrane protein n=1 Tax=Methylogaea oryzae TaxID=1295382 RepID=A0A8D5AGB8_9GAMM|nr:membrane protein [Methylogaea oryzae]
MASLNEIPSALLLSALFALLLLSAFFAGAETALMTLNRYRLQHLAKEKHPGALRSQKLLQRPDRLIGFILLGNIFANILASSLTTILALRWFGESGVAPAAGALTLVVLIFSEVAPKTMAALHPEKLAFPASWLILPLLKLCYPMVWVVNAIANFLLRIFGFRPEAGAHSPLSKEELRTVVAEAGAMIPERYQNMLLGILDLETATVEDIMVPRNQIVGIDLEDSIEAIQAQIVASRYTRLPVYQKSIDKVTGILHLRKALIAMKQGAFDKGMLKKQTEAVTFVPENTPLHRLLINFRRDNRRIGLVVDEYGDVRGLVTLSDLLEEIIGEFTTDPQDIQKQRDGSFLVHAGVTVRELNRVAGYSLPTEGPKTLNGLIIEYLETIPAPGVSLKLFGHQVEITHMEGNAVKQVRLSAPLET